MSIRIYPSDQARSEFAALRQFLKSLESPTETEKSTVSRAVRAEFGSNFANEGSGQPSGSWPGLAKRTQRERRALGFPPAHPILVRGGEYMRSFLNPTANNEEVTSNESGWHMEYGSEHDFVRHHEGPRALHPNNPERSVMNLTSASENRLGDALDAMFMTRQVPVAR